MRKRKARKTAAEPVAPEIPAHVRERILTMKIYFATRDARKCVREEILEVAGEPAEWHEIMRRAVGFAGFPATCPRASCRRARRCTTTFAVCRFERSLEFEPHNNRFAENQAKHGDPFHGE